MIARTRSYDYVCDTNCLRKATLACKAPSKCMCGHLMSSPPPSYPKQTLAATARSLAREKTHLRSQKGLAVPCEQCVTVRPQTAGQASGADQGQALRGDCHWGATATCDWHPTGVQQYLHGDDGWCTALHDDAVGLSAIWYLVPLCAYSIMQIEAYAGRAIRTSKQCCSRPTGKEPTAHTFDAVNLEADCSVVAGKAPHLERQPSGTQQYRTGVVHKRASLRPAQIESERLLLHTTHGTPE